MTTPPIRQACGCSTAKRCGEQRPAQRQSRAPTAMATQREHERRGGTLSGVQHGARQAGRSRKAHQPVPKRSAEGDSVRTRKQGAAGPDGVSWPTSRAECRLRRTRRTAAAPSRPAGRCTMAARVSSICRARNATTTMGQASSPAAHDAGAPDRLSDLPAGMAEHRIAATPPAQLHRGHARRALRLWLARNVDLEPS